MTHRKVIANQIESHAESMNLLHSGAQGREKEKYRDRRNATNIVIEFAYRLD